MLGSSVPMGIVGGWKQLKAAKTAQSAAGFAFTPTLSEDSDAEMKMEPFFS